jgi:two-component system, cell cycle sensor histidine kinase and response regulator CckA
LSDNHPQETVMDQQSIFNQLTQKSFENSRNARVLLAEEKIIHFNAAFSELSGYQIENIPDISLKELFLEPPRSGFSGTNALITKNGEQKIISFRVETDGNSGEIIFDLSNELGTNIMALRLEKILEITRHMSSTLKSDEIIHEASKACAMLVQAKSTSVFRLNESGDSLKLIFTDDQEFYDSLMDFEIPVGTGLTGHVVATGKPAFVNDTSNSDITIQVPGTPEEDEEALMSFPLRTPDKVLGAITLSRDASQPFNNSDLEIISILAGQVSAILENAELVNKLAKSEYELRSLVNNTNVGLFRLDNNGSLLSTNPFISSLFELEVDVSLSVQNIWGSEKSHQAFVSQTKEQGSISGFESRSVTGKGRLIELSFSGSHFPDLGYIEGVLHDMTEQKRLETVNRNRLRFLENLIKQIPLSLLVFNPKGKLVQLNNSFSKLFNLPVEEKSQNNFVQTILEHSSDLNNLWESCIKGQFVGSEDIQLAGHFFKEDNIDRYFTVTGFPVINNTGNVTEIVFLLEDTTNRVELNKHLLHSQKLDSISTMAGGIAHDFNNILSGILGNVTFLKNEFQQSSSAINYLEIIERATGQAGKLTRQLLDFSKPDKGKLEPSKVNELVLQTTDLFRRTIDPEIELDIDLDRLEPEALCDTLQIEQALLNVLINAAESIKESGKISIKTRVRYENDFDEYNVPDLKRGTYVEIEVQDTGCGIPDEMNSKIFDPFFSTKSGDENAGLGLATVYSILRSHNGHIDLASKASMGTRIRLLIPSSTSSEDQEQRYEEDALTSGSIMVVDDEDIIRDMLCRILDSLGYSVIAFAGGKDALAHLKSNPDAVDLVILDMLMPTMSGIEVYNEIMEINSEAKILICSGYTASQHDELLDMEGICGFIEKPFTIDDLTKLVQNALN